MPKRKPGVANKFGMTRHEWMKLPYLLRKKLFRESRYWHLLEKPPEAPPVPRTKPAAPFDALYEPVPAATPDARELHKRRRG